MNAYGLPTSLRIGGKDYAIETDFRKIINVLTAFNDPDLDDETKSFVFFSAFFKEEIPRDCLKEAYEAGMDFIEAGIKSDGKPAKRMMDWEQDAPLIIPAVNKVAGMEIRALPYLHWWTFLSYYMEIGESQFSNVLQIREKKRKGKKLEKWEAAYYRENKQLVDLKEKVSEDDEQALAELLGE